MGMVHGRDRIDAFGKQPVRPESDAQLTNPTCWYSLGLHQIIRAQFRLCSASPASSDLVQPIQLPQCPISNLLLKIQRTMPWRRPPSSLSLLVTPPSSSHSGSRKTPRMAEIRSLTLPLSSLCAMTQLTNSVKQRSTLIQRSRSGQIIRFFAFSFHNNVG